MARTLSYSRLLPVAPDRLHAAICASQLQYFQNYSRKIRELQKGISVRRDFYTKLNSEKIPGKSVLSELEADRIVLDHIYGANKIEGAWILEEQQGQTRLTYQETSTFADAARQRNFSLVSFFYRYFFRRQTRKRFDWLCEQCGGAA